eukprot:1231957-Rhodomonas_salina.4
MSSGPEAVSKGASSLGSGFSHRFGSSEVGHETVHASKAAVTGPGKEPETKDSEHEFKSAGCRPCLLLSQIHAAEVPSLITDRPSPHAAS